jgi:hypothetical protein
MPLMKRQNFVLWYFHDKGLSTQSEVLDMMLDLDKEEE